tara:strand:- start:489 stop:809 length:321 start_codon:yes stop_codon:yes gene_type:complete
MTRLSDFHGELDGPNEALRRDPSEKFLDRITEGSDRHASAVLDSFGFGAPPEPLANRTRREVISSQILGCQNQDEVVMITQEEIDQAKAEFSKRTGWRSEHDHHPA